MRDKIEELAAYLDRSQSQEVPATLECDRLEASIKPHRDSLNDVVHVLRAFDLFISTQHLHDQKIEAIAATTDQLVPSRGISRLNPVDRILNLNRLQRRLVHRSCPIAPGAALMARATPYRSVTRIELTMSALPRRGPRKTLTKPSM
jgi:hypothetical protein